jgi:hypothetical protein
VLPAEGTRAGARGSGSRVGGRAAPLEKTTELTQAIYEHAYRTWSDDPIPILDGGTPRQTMGSASGREQVAEIRYEVNEEREAEREKREPASFEFVWRSVGSLDRVSARGVSPPGPLYTEPV